MNLGNWIAAGNVVPMVMTILSMMTASLKATVRIALLEVMTMMTEIVRTIAIIALLACLNYAFYAFGYARGVDKTVQTYKKIERMVQDDD